MKRLRYLSLAVGVSLVAAGFFAAVPANAQDPLPDTGNTKCLNETAGEIDCTVDTAPCFGQDAYHATQGVGCPFTGRFDIHDGGTPGTGQMLQLDDTVTDNCTGLMWQRETADITGDNVVDTFSSNDDEPTWQEALKYCDCLEFGVNPMGGGTYDDWRLPNIRELLSINKWGNEAGNYEIRASAPPFNTFVGAGWSSTTATSFSGSAFVVEQGGFSKDSPKMSNGGVTVRCVRTVLVTDGGAAGLERGGGAGRGGADGDGARRGGGAGPMCATDNDNGNVNGDGARDLSDAVYELAWLFQGGPEPEPFCIAAGAKVVGCAVDNGNTNGDAARDLSDVIYLLAWLFQGGPAPVGKCGGTPPPEICDDLGGDEDGDGLTDCDDPDCALDPSCPQTETCTGGVDEDGDGDTDCDDSDCAANPLCLPETSCTDGIDEDLDGDTDCDDSDCGRNSICAQGDNSSLPDTGQTKCYDDTDPPNEISCQDADFPGQDGFYSTGCPMNELRFVDNGDDTVTDTCTGLMWQQNTADIDGGGFDPDPGSGDQVNWCDALAYCEGLTFAGESDWRLPNVLEAQSLGDYSQAAPAMDTDIFGVARVGSVAVYWTSTSQGPETDPPKVERAWWFYTHLGEVSPNGTPGLKTAENFVRAVRDTP